MNNVAGRNGFLESMISGRSVGRTGEGLHRLDSRCVGNHERFGLGSVMRLTTQRLTSRWCAFLGDADGGVCLTKREIFEAGQFRQAFQWVLATKRGGVRVARVRES